MKPRRLLVVGDRPEDQIAAFMSGELLWWWFSDRAIDQHAAHRLELRPGSPAD